MASYAPPAYAPPPPAQNRYALGLQALSCEAEKIAVADDYSAYRQEKIAMAARYFGAREAWAGAFERHAGLEAEPCSRVVYGHERERVLDRLNDDERRRLRRYAAGARDPVGREPPQPYREVAPVARKFAHHGSNPQ